MAKLRKTTTLDMFDSLGDLIHPADYWHCNCGHRHKTIQAAIKCGNRYTPRRAPTAGYDRWQDVLRRQERQSRRKPTN